MVGRTAWPPWIAETGVVTPLHKDKTGTLSFSGLYLTGDGRGTHAHTLDRPERPALCRAIVARYSDRHPEVRPPIHG